MHEYIHKTTNVFLNFFEFNSILSLLAATRGMNNSLGKSTVVLLNPSESINSYTHWHTTIVSVFLLGKLRFREFW